MYVKYLDHVRCYMVNKDSNPLVSVVLSVFNDEAYVRESIESIIEQTYSNLEIIIINDGSNESTVKILEEYQEKDNRIKLIHQSNKGLALSLNRGMELASGFYIARMDSDDISLKGRIATQVKALLKNKDVVALGSNADVIDRDGVYIYKIEKPLTWDEIKKTLPYRSPFIHPSVIFKREEALKVGGYPNVPVGQDLLFFSKLSKIGKFMNIDESLIKYRINPMAVSRKSSEIKKIFKLIIEEYIDKGTLNDDLVEELKRKKTNQGQRSKHYEYHLLLAKKYLWNNFQKQKSRENSRAAFHNAKGKEYFMPVILYMSSYFGDKNILKVYKHLKKSNN